MTDYYPCEICDTSTNANNGHVCDQCYDEVMDAFDVYLQEQGNSSQDSSS